MKKNSLSEILTHKALKESNVFLRKKRTSGAAPMGVWYTKIWLYHFSC